jgi:hypothetical protein
MKVETGPVTTADALKFADELEAAMGEVMNGQRKAGKLPVEPMCRLIQFARNGVAVQEAWEAAGGNPSIRAGREELMEALRQLDAVCDEADKAK